MKSILFVAILVVGAAAQNFAINTPIPGGVECQPLLVSWVGGTPPYVVTVQTNPVGTAPVASFGQQTGTSLTWPAVNVTTGSSLILQIKDSNGQSRSSTPFPVLPGSGVGCIGDNGGISSGGLSSSLTSDSSTGASTHAGATSSASQTPNGPPLNTGPPAAAITKKKNLAGPIAAGVVGGLIALAALGFCLCRTHGRDGKAARTGGLDDREKEPSLLMPSRQDEPPAQLFSVLPSGETQLSLPNQVPRGILAAEEKARRGPGQQMGFVQQDIQELQKLVDESTVASFATRSDSSNAELMDEMRKLREQMHTIEQRIQVESATDLTHADKSPPEYTAKQS